MATSISSLSNFGFQKPTKALRDSFCGLPAVTVMILVHLQLCGIAFLRAQSQ